MVTLNRLTRSTGHDRLPTVLVVARSFLVLVSYLSTLRLVALLPIIVADLALLAGMASVTLTIDALIPALLTDMNQFGSIARALRRVSLTGIVVFSRVKTDRG